MEKKNYTESNQVDNRVNINEDEIDFVEIVKKLWRNRRFIFKVTAIFAILGFLAAISSPNNVYTASCTMVLQTGNNSSGGSFGGLATLAGINLGSSGSGAVLSPAVYPKIMSNINFQKELIYSKFNFEGVEQPMTLYDYYTDKKYQKFNLIGTIKKYTIGLPGVIIGTLKGMYGALNSKLVAVESKKDDINHSYSTSIQSLTAGEKGVSNIISSNLSLINKDGFIMLTSNMPEPLVAAELVQKGLELLQKYITRFKIEKVTSNLEFIERSYEEAKRNFEAKQEELARFRDSNKSFASAVAKTQEEKLMSEYTLLLGIYTELATQKEQAKIAVTETTPILTVIEPVVVPIEKTQSKRFMKLFIYTFLGFIIGVGIVFFVTYLKSNFIPDIKKYRFIPKIN